MSAEHIYLITLDIPFDLFGQLDSDSLDDAIDEIQNIDGVEKIWYDHCCGCEISIDAATTWIEIQKEIDEKYAKVLSVIQRFANAAS